MNTPNRRLELRFRPDDMYCKPTCGDRYNTKGFLLRVRVKKSRVKKVEEFEAKKGEKQSMVTKNTDNAQSDNNVQNNADTVQSPGTRGIESRDANTESRNQERVISELADQVQSCSVGSLDCTPGPSHKILFPEGVKDFQDLSIDNDTSFTKNKKNTPPTFDRNKYEDLSEDKDYELPKLKVLGRVDTEFRFTSMRFISLE